MGGHCAPQGRSQIREQNAKKAQNARLGRCTPLLKLRAYL
uniref:Uncharacterized protein n=1 Tax=Anguilla anguilla TaxID=7936 RepID=A0A0E9Q0K5_ANGAN